MELKLSVSNLIVKVIDILYKGYNWSFRCGYTHLFVVIENGIITVFLF